MSDDGYSREDASRDTMRPEALGGDLPDPADATPHDASEGGSGLRDAPEQPSGGDPRQTAPVFGAEMHVGSFQRWFQRRPDGGMQMKVLAVMQVGGSRIPQLPCYVVEFSAEGWEEFKRDVAADGAERPRVPVATRMPTGPVVI